MRTLFLECGDRDCRQLLTLNLNEILTLPIIFFNNSLKLQMSLKLNVKTT